MIRQCALLFLLFLLLAVSACTPIRAVEATNNTPSGLWVVTPGGTSDTLEYMYQGPDREDESCMSVTIHKNTLPQHFELYVQQGDNRWAYDINELLVTTDTVTIPLTQFMYKDPIFGKLDDTQLYPGGEIDLAGIHVDDRTREFSFTVTDLSFVDSCLDDAN
jgi:hypothetical protein